MLGLRCFGKAFNFYNRQIATLSAISEAQARVQDVDTKVPVGKIPNLAEIVEYFRQTQPADRASIVHGDFKIDNLVFHETEPRVIGILEYEIFFQAALVVLPFLFASYHTNAVSSWEMSTIGHPLSDLVNLTVPYLQEERSLGRGTGRGSNDFKPGVTLGLPTRDTIVRWYREAAGWDPSTDLPWGDAFGMLRATIIIQGIAGRYATRQASGIKAKEFASKLAPFAEYTWRLVSQLRERNLNSQARL